MPDPLESYLRDLRDIHASGAGVDETSYYVPLANLLNDIGKSLKPKVRCIINLKNQGAGLPDGGLFTPDQFPKASAQEPLAGQLPARGAIEVKGPGENLTAVAERKQIRDYREQYRLLLITNYRDFQLLGYDHGGRPVQLEGYTLADSEAALWAAAAHPQMTAAEHGERLVEYLRRVMLTRAQLAEPKVVAAFLASYAREAKARVEAAHGIPALDAVRGALEEALGLRFEGEKGEHFFRSSLVQTLFYGIFSAWVLWSRQHPPGGAARFAWREALWYLRVPMIRALFEQISTPSHLQPLDLVEVLDWAGDVLDRVDRASFFSRFEEGQAVQYFYEPFLEAFDPELRKELGVWYTPPEIVQYMVARAEQVLREELGIADGLADPSVYILDPCCGTGTYLLEVLKRIAATLKEKGEDALLAQDLKRAAMQRVFGFEILPAPFVVSHLQLGLALQHLGAPLSDTGNERIGVFLTNALTGWEPPQGIKKHLPFPEMEQERDAAERVKQEAPILVILGNPPYNGFAGVSPAEEQGLIEPYKAGLKDWGISKNYLDDLYVRFFRLAERRIAEKTGRGVVCYISNFSYLGDQSFVVMRKRFLDGFDRLWFDCMNGDSRKTGKRTPDGKPDPSVFSSERSAQGIRVGTAIALMVRTPMHQGQATVRFRHFWGSTKRADLVASLTSAGRAAAYETVSPTLRNRYSFRPLTASVEYDGWPALTELCAVTPMLGLNDNRGQGTHAIGRDEIAHRMQAYFDARVSDDALRRLHPGLITNAASFNATATRARLQRESAFSEANIRRFWFKPYDLRWAYVERIANLWNRVRPELVDQAWDGNRFLMARRHTSASIDGAAFFFGRHVSDQHAMHTDAYFIPARIRAKPAPSTEQESLLEAAPEIKANLSVKARSYLKALGVGDPDASAESAEAIWLHALAIGYSPRYLSENRDAVKDDWPRVPLPADPGALTVSAALGTQIAALLDVEADVQGVTAGGARGELKPLALISRLGPAALNPAAGELAVTAGWGHVGKDGVIMPGAGSIVERPYTSEELAAITEGAAALNLTREDALAQLGQTTRDIYLNDVAYWRNIPEKVWTYTIGGYQVMKKWLSYREEDLLGRPLTPEEVREVTNMARRIAAILLLESALDENYQKIKASAFPWAAALPK